MPFCYYKEFHKKPLFHPLFEDMKRGLYNMSVGITSRKKLSFFVCFFHSKNLSLLNSRSLSGEIIIWLIVKNGGRDVCDNFILNLELCSVLNIIEQITIIGGLKRKCEDRNVYLKLSNSIF